MSKKLAYIDQPDVPVWPRQSQNKVSPGIALHRRKTFSLENATERLFQFFKKRLQETYFFKDVGLYRYLRNYGKSMLTYLEILKDSIDSFQTDQLFRDGKFGSFVCKKFKLLQAS